MKPITTFQTKSGKEIEIWLPAMDRLPALLEFVNRLVDEDTFLTFTGKPKSLEEERLWLKSNLENIKIGKTFLIWAVCDNKIIGQSDIVRGGTRDWHVGRIGLMVDRDFRQDGIGRFLLDYILNKAKEKGIKIATMDVFADNRIAISLYKKFGFKKWAHLPNGFYRRGKYSNAIKIYKEL